MDYHQKKISIAASSGGPLSKEEMQQYCFMLLGIDDAGLLTIALNEIFGDGALVSTHAID